jgi:hypothetical protein
MRRRQAPVWPPRPEIEVEAIASDARPIRVRVVDAVAAEGASFGLAVDDALELAAQLLERVAAVRRRT